MASRMVFGIVGLWICLFLSALETTIIATALQTIAKDLNGATTSSWVVVVYLLTYNGFLLLFAALTKAFNEKPLLMYSQIVFMVSSLACGAATTMPQLVVFRAFQGIGGSGIYSIVFIIIAKMVTVDDVGKYTGILSSVFALASLLGPIVGGAIVDNTSWRWVFFINGPGICLSLLLVHFAVPSPERKLFDKERIKRIDTVGAFLVLAWQILLVFGLQEAGDGYSWRSAPIVGTLAGGGVGLVLFVFHELRVQNRAGTDPIFPLRLLKSKTLSLNLITIFALGGCFYSAMILLPRRFQSVNGLSAFEAGIAMLAFTLVSPVCSILCGMFLSKRKWTAHVFLILGSVLSTVAIGLLSSLHGPIAPSTYGYEVILGAGLGMMMPPLVFFLKLDFDGDDLAIVIGANNTARTLGGCVALAICSTVLNEDVTSRLSTFLTPQQIPGILRDGRYSSELSDKEREEVRDAFSKGYDKEYLVLLGFAALGFFGSITLGLLSLSKTWRTRTNRPQ